MKKKNVGLSTVKKKLNLSGKIYIHRLDIPHNIFEMCDISD